MKSKQVSMTMKCHITKQRLTYGTTRKRHRIQIVTGNETAANLKDKLIGIKEHFHPETENQTPLCQNNAVHYKTEANNVICY